MLGKVSGQTVVNGVPAVYVRFQDAAYDPHLQLVCLLDKGLGLKEGDEVEVRRVGERA